MTSLFKALCFGVNCLTNRIFMHDGIVSPLRKRCFLGKIMLKDSLLWLIIATAKKNPIRNSNVTAMPHNDVGKSKSKEQYACSGQGMLSH